jgi:hypothetical protein
MRLTAAATQRALVLGTSMLVCLGVMSAAPSARLGAQNRDSVNTRNALERDIRRFQQRWRDQWIKSMVERGEGISNWERDTLDNAYGNFTSRLLRLHALSCYAEYADFRQLHATPLDAFGNARRVRTSPQSYSSVQSRNGESLNLLLPARVHARGNDLSVCPRWIPEEEGIPPDEGERLDLALSPKRRDDIMQQRTALLERLEAAAQKSPADGWITGQRVRFLLDNYQFEPALEVAQECRADRAWCAALEGLVRTQSGEFALADRAFDRSLEGGVRAASGECADTTARPLFELGDRLSQRNTPCNEWRAITNTTWWLSDPLWSQPGNQRRAEHYARRTMLTLRTTLEEDERHIWRKSAAGDALQEVIMRYGWPSYTWWGGWDVDSRIATYTAERLRVQAEHPYTVKEYSTDRLAMVPSFSAIASPFDAVDSHWQWDKPENALRERWFPIEHMAPPVQLARMPEGQRVVLRRDSTVQFGWVIDKPVTLADSTNRSALRPVLFAGRDAASTREIVDTILTPGEPLRLAGSFDPEPVVLSLEVPARSPRDPSHRWRAGFVPPPSLAQMSDTSLAVSDPALVLLPFAGAAPPNHPDSVIAQLAGSTSLPRDTPVALYWESYGFGLGDTIDVEIRIARRDGSALRSVAAFFGVADAQRDSVSIRWREPDPGRNARALPALRSTVARAVSVDIGNLAPGSYVFIIEMKKTDGRMARGELRLEVRE